MVKEKQSVCELCGEKNDSKKECSCQNEKPIKVRFCPECKSTEVKFVFKMKNLFGLLPRVECTKCGNSGFEFPIVVVKPQNLKKKKGTHRSVYPKLESKGAKHG